MNQMWFVNSETNAYILVWKHGKDLYYSRYYYLFI